MGNRVKSSPTTFDTSLFKPFEFLGFDSGTSALAIALTAVAKSRQDIETPHVLLPAYTCPDVVSACLFANVRPVLVDLCEDTPYMDLNDLASKINPACIAIIAINFMGIPERIGAIRSSTLDMKPVIIEDSAQGFPKAAYEKYWLGDLIIVSFGRGKPVNLLGGGGVFYRSDKISPKLTRSLRNASKYADKEERLLSNKTNSTEFFKRIIYKIKIRLFNLLSRPFFYAILSRLTFLKLGATIFYPLEVVSKLPIHIEQTFSTNYQAYCHGNSLKEEYDAIFTGIASEQIISLPIIVKQPNDYPLLRYPILIKEATLKASIYKKLKNAGLGVSLMYQDILPDVEGVEHSTLAKFNRKPNASRLAKSLVTLPIHQDTTGDHVRRIKQIIESCVLEFRFQNPKLNKLGH